MVVSMVVRFEDWLRPLRLIQNLGMSHTVPIAVDPLSAIQRMQWQVIWACPESKSPGKTLRVVRPWKQAMAWSIDSSGRQFENALNPWCSLRMLWIQLRILFTTRFGGWMWYRICDISMSSESSGKGSCESDSNWFSYSADGAGEVGFPNKLNGWPIIY